MNRRLLPALLSTVIVLGLAACGGSGSSPSTAAAPQTRDYTLEQESDAGLHQAFATFTENGDKTSAVFDMSTDRTKEPHDARYPVAVRAGDCSSLGDVERDFGELPSGVNTLSVDASFDDVVGSIDDHRSSITIMESDGRTVAWCGPA